MPFAIYSKRTKVVKRIVHSLRTMLASEGMIELDENVAFPRRYDTTLIGQTVSTAGLRQFDVGAGEEASDPIDEAGAAREPLLSQFVQIGRVEMSVTSAPLSWVAEDLIQAKYEAILAKNRPYHVVVGEEFVDLTHIDDTPSADYLLANGKGIILPGGNITTEELVFRLPRTDQGGNPANRDAYDHFHFDTLYCRVTPAQDLGLTMTYDVRSEDDDDLDGPLELQLNEEMDLGAVKKYGIVLTFTNNSNYPVAMENYMLFLQRRSA